MKKKPPRDLGRLRCAALLCGALAAPLAGQAACLGMVLHAHRGEAGSPENSLRAVEGALSGAWDGAEIDIQQLRDGAWVLHHDPQLGRTTSLRGRTVASIDSAAWKEVRLKDRAGRVTAESAPFLDDVAQAAAAHGGKVLNVEIKQINGDCQPARSAATDLHRALPQGQWFLTSVDRRQLQCARQSDPQGYLGLIVLDAQALALGSSNRLAQRSAGHLGTPVIDRDWLMRLAQEVGQPVGVHVDIHTLRRNPGVLATARELGMPVFTYHLGADREHAQALQAARRQGGLLPSGAIIDGDAGQFCRMVSAQ